MGKTFTPQNKTMQSFDILNQKFSTIQSLKDFALLHDIIPTGNKSIKENWVKAITIYLTAQDNIVAVVVEADPIASEIATTIEDVAGKVGTVAVKVLTSETAVLAYRVVLKAVAFALVMGWLVSVAAVKWCWQHRSHTAIYHWIKAAIGSEVTQWAVVYLFLGQWVINEWIDTVRSAVRSTVTTCRAWADGKVGEVRSVVG